MELGDVAGEEVTDGWVFLGQVRPALEAEIAAAVGGHVLEVTVREGDPVKKGQKLVRLDAAEVGARVSAARAKLRGIETELELARRQRDRVKDLDFPTVSEPEKERFELTVQNLEAQKATQAAELQRTQVERSQHLIKAPFDGTVQDRHVDPGAWVNVGQPIIEVVATEELEVHVDVSAELGARLKPGEVAELVGPSGRAKAEVVGMVPALDPSTGTMRIRLRPDEDQARPPWLIAGMPIDVEFQVSFGGGVTVHPDALVRGPVSTKVIKFDGGKGVPIQVQIVAETQDRALIRADGLSPGDQVVVRGNERLRPGQPLKVKDSEPAPPAQKPPAEKG